MGKLKQKLKKALKIGIASAVTIPFYTLAHEYLHFGAAKIMDSSAKLQRINFNSLYGGKILEKLSDKIYSVNENIFYGATIRGTVNTPLNDLENIIMFSAPYILAPIGMYFVYDGIKNKKSYGLGVGLIPAISLLVHYGMAGTGVKGADFNGIKEILNKHTNNGFLSSAFISGAVVLTYIGSYFLAKKLVNWKDKVFSKKSKS